MYDLEEIRKTYFENYRANGGNTTLAKREALREHGVKEEDLAHVSSQLSGSGRWDKLSEIPRPQRPRTRGNTRKIVIVPTTQQVIDFKSRAAGER